MRPTRCEISTKAFCENFEILRALLPGSAEFLAVVKADAYGHGAVGISKLLTGLQVRRFAVATVREAIELREAGIVGEILLLGGAYGEFEAIVQKKLTPVFSDLEALSEWAGFLKARHLSIPCHLKFDTGMGRLGFLHPESVVEFLKNHREVNVSGAMTHMTVADECERDSREYTEGQIGRFEAILPVLKSIAPELQYAHLTNSALLLRRDRPLLLPEGVGLLARPGLALYGVPPQEWLEEGLPHKLLPVLSWKTAIHSIKDMEAGLPISYGRTFVTARPSKIAVLPVGYADGYPRTFSNRASVLIRGQRAPIVGRVCMDLTMVDVSEIDGVSRGDEVVLLGSQGEWSIPVQELAELDATIPYEIFCGIGKRVERVVV